MLVEKKQNPAGLSIWSSTFKTKKNTRIPELQQWLVISNQFDKSFLVKVFFPPKEE